VKRLVESGGLELGDEMGIRVHVGDDENESEVNLNFAHDRIEFVRGELTDLMNDDLMT
jgi:hypothetical protein